MLKNGSLMSEDGQIRTTALAHKKTHGNRFQQLVQQWHPIKPSLPLSGGPSDTAECLLISLFLCSSWTYVQLLSSYWTPSDFKSKASALWWRAAIVSSVGVCVNKPGTVRPIIHFVNEIAMHLGLVWSPWRTKAHLSQSQPCISCEAGFFFFPQSFSHVLWNQTECQCSCDRFYVCPIVCTGSFVCVSRHCPRNETWTQKHQNNSHFEIVN